MFCYLNKTEKNFWQTISCNIETQVFECDILNSNELAPDYLSSFISCDSLLSLNTLAKMIFL